MRPSDLQAVEAGMRPSDLQTVDGVGEDSCASRQQQQLVSNGWLPCSEQRKASRPVIVRLIAAPTVYWP